MAIYHLTAKTGSKAKGQSAGAKYVYICRDAKYAKRQDELVFRTSGHMPEWAVADPAAYWRAAVCSRSLNLPFPVNCQGRRKNGLRAVLRST